MMTREKITKESFFEWHWSSTLGEPCPRKWTLHLIEKVFIVYVDGDTDNIWIGWKIQPKNYLSVIPNLWVRGSCSHTGDVKTGVYINPPLIKNVGVWWNAI